MTIVKSPSAAARAGKPSHTPEPAGKPYIVTHPKTFLGKSMGSGQCVALVQNGAHMPLTASWRRGQKVKGADIAPGTVIATFDENGHYTNGPQSHAAIYMGQNASGIQVIDQWVIKKSHGPAVRLDASRRTIRWKNGGGNPVDDGDQFYVVN